MKTPQEILRTITCNGMRELTETRAIQAMEDYARRQATAKYDLLCPSYKEMVYGHWLKTGASYKTLSELYGCPARTAEKIIAECFGKRELNTIEK